MPRSARWLGGIATVPFLAAAGLYMFYIIFSQKSGDDEGYLMISIRGFLEGHPLYDSVFTQYGPVYYLYEWLLRSLTRLPMTHDATRFLCMVHWLLAAAALGVAGGLICRSVLGGIFVFMQAVIHLTMIANEPGHPQEIVAALLAFSLLAATAFSPTMRTLKILALIAGALLFIKVNVGAFFFLALLLVIRCRSLDRWAGGGWFYSSLAICAALPFLLMRFHLTQAWGRNYSILAAVTIVTTVFAARTFSDKSTFSPAQYLGLAGTFLGASVCFLAATMLKGSSFQGIVDGLFLTPLKLPGVAFLKPAVPNGLLWNAAASIAGACLVLLARPPGRFNLVLILAKGIYGLTACFFAVSDVNLQFAYLMPWIWLALVPVSGQHWSAGESFARTFLGVTAAWQVLQAYPIAGTQVALATLFLVVVGSVCLMDAGRALAAEGLGERLAQLPVRPLLLAQGLALAAMLYLFADSWCELQTLRERYLSLIPFDLPGSRFIRLDRESVVGTHALVGYLKTECDTFITYPGYNSLYFWTGKNPPTQLNSTGWGQFDARQQMQILAAVSRVKRPMILVHEYMRQSWAQNVPVQIQPLVRFLRDDCQQTSQIGRFLVYVPKVAMAPSQP